MLDFKISSKCLNFVFFTFIVEIILKDKKSMETMKLFTITMFWK